MCFTLTLALPTRTRSLLLPLPPLRPVDRELQQLVSHSLRSVIELDLEVLAQHALAALQCLIPGVIIMVRL